MATFQLIGISFAFAHNPFDSSFIFALIKTLAIFFAIESLEIRQFSALAEGQLNINDFIAQFSGKKKPDIEDIGFSNRSLTMARSASVAVIRSSAHRATL
jgi:hypothetical protein